MTLNEELLATWPPTVTENGPDEAPDGTTAKALESLQLTIAAFTPCSATVLVPCVAPKSVPVMVTKVPTIPDDG